MTNKAIELAAKQELKRYIDFFSKAVFKNAYEADYQENLCRDKIKSRFTRLNYKELLPFDWKEAIGYIDTNDNDKIKLRSDSWPWYIIPLNNNDVESFGVDSDKVIWIKRKNIPLWQSSTNRTKLNEPEGIYPISIPENTRYAVYERANTSSRILIGKRIWHDENNSVISLVSPFDNYYYDDESGIWKSKTPDNELIFEKDNDSFEGLSDIIPSPDVYPHVILECETMYDDDIRKNAYLKAIEYFDIPSTWTDPNADAFLRNQSGLILGSDGQPIANPNKTIAVKYRGEINNYYRSLVAHHDISPYKSRLATNFEIIKYYNVSGLDQKTVQRILSIYNECIVVYNKVYHDYAYTYQPLYQAYANIFIIWMAINRLINEKMIGIQDIDVMERVDLDNLLYSFGIYTFDDLPLSYKRRFGKALNSLLKNKGTTTALVSVIELFGLKQEVQIVKYFLAKHYSVHKTIIKLHRKLIERDKLYICIKKPLTGEILYEESISMDNPKTILEQLKEILNDLIAQGYYRDTSIVTEKGFVLHYTSVDSIYDIDVQIHGTDVEGRPYYLNSEIDTTKTDYSLPDVSFIEHPMNYEIKLESVLDKIEKDSLLDYTEFVSGDSRWETTKEEALIENFSILQTKYIGVNAILDVVQTNTAMSFLWALIKDANMRGMWTEIRLGFEDTALPSVSDISLLNAMVAIQTLLMWKLDYEDIIPKSEDDIERCFQAGYYKPSYPNEELISPFYKMYMPGELINNEHPNAVVTTSKNLFNERGIRTSIGDLGKTQSKLDALKREELRKLYFYKTTANYTNKTFRHYKTYSDWLYADNIELWKWVKEEDRKNTYDEAIIILASMVEDFVNSEGFSIGAPLLAANLLKDIIVRMLIFFKAYTIDLKKFAFIYLIDNEGLESIRPIDFLEKLGVTIKKYDVLFNADNDRKHGFMINHKYEDSLRAKFEDALDSFKINLKQTELTPIHDLNGLHFALSKLFIEPSNIKDNSPIFGAKMILEDSILKRDKKIHTSIKKSFSSHFDFKDNASFKKYTY